MCGEWQEKRAGGDIEDEEWDWEREVEEWDKERDRVEEAAEEWEEEVEFLKYKPLSQHTGTTRARTGVKKENSQNQRGMGAHHGATPPDHTGM